MQVDGKIAKVYAVALFELVLEDAGLSDLDVALQELYSALSKDRAVWSFLSSPVLEPKHKIGLLQRSLEHQAPKVLVNFLCLLALRNRMAALPGICEEFTALSDERLGRKRALLRSACQVDAADLEGVRTALSNYFKKDIELESRVEAELIGGLVIKAGNMLMDTSIRSKLRRLKKQMIEHKIFGEKYYEN